MIGFQGDLSDRPDLRNTPAMCYCQHAADGAFSRRSETCKSVRRSAGMHACDALGMLLFARFARMQKRATGVS